MIINKTIKVNDADKIFKSNKIVEVRLFGR